MFDLKLYFHNLTFYDYIGLGWLFFAFILLLIFAIYFINKKPLFSLFMILFSFSFLVFGFFGVKYFLNQTVRKNVTKIEDIKPLHFSNSIIITGYIKNMGKINYKECFINIKIIKSSNNKIKEFINLLKPIKKETISINKQINKDKSYNFKITVNNIIYRKDYNISSKTICY